MSIQLQFEEMPGYLAIRFSGVGSTEELRRQFELIAEHCKRANKNKLLLDFTEFYTEIPHARISIEDRYFSVRESQIFARYMSQVACVARPERIDPRRFGELAAQNRWINLRGFTNVEDAEEWLLKYRRAPAGVDYKTY